MASLTDTQGTPYCQSGQPAPAAFNVRLPANPVDDSNSQAIVANLNSALHVTDIYEFGTTVFDAAQGTPRTVVCTEPWGTCALSQQPIAINAAWKPSSGSDGAFAVVDFTARQIYDFWAVDRNSDGTVMIYPDGTVHAGWGGVSSLDGDGVSPGATGSNLGHLYGMTRVFEIQQAVSRPSAAANAIRHALQFSSKYTCATYRPPATKSDGSQTGACIPMGTRVYLDAATDCTQVVTGGGGPGEFAVCEALKAYGAFCTDSGGATLALGFEGPSSGQPGGSGPDPYPSAGFAWDYFDLSHIPWSHLHVAANQWGN